MRTVNTHRPVLLKEAVDSLALSANDEVIDATFGSGGHSREILARIAPHGRLLGFDRDRSAIQSAQRRFRLFLNRLILINDSYSQLEKYVKHYQFNNVAGVLFDLGFSSTQLADRNRGFSFQTHGPLDLRYDTSQGLSAADLLNTAKPSDLERILLEGGEPQAHALTKAIVAARRQRPFVTTTDLLSVVMRVKGRGRRSLPPATLVWQALRLAVNQELSELKKGLEAAVRVLRSGGRLVVISFHSGEDRIVKNFFRQEARDCLCPPAWPECRCHHQRILKILTPKPIRPTPEELKLNPRAASAKLRVAEKL